MLITLYIIITIIAAICGILHEANIQLSHYRIMKNEHRKVFTKKN